jgi:TolB-like protein/DNA-binding winged helix-turn-helix (wHTH) protein/Tfp pilus assembly protein PilF
MEKRSTMPPPLTPDNGASPRRFRIGDLEVDVGKAEVTRGDDQIALPKLSFDLLLALINAAPSIVTNDELLQQVWPGLLVSPESVAQRVKLLRSTLGDDSQQPRYILGVRGRGYRLIPVPERLAESRPPMVDAGNPSIKTPILEIPVAAGEESTPLPQAVPTRRADGAGKRAAVAAIVLVAVCVVVAAGWHYWRSHNAAEPAIVAMADKSIAVLAFTDMSEKKDQEYFGDGMAEEIIDLLVKIPELKVIGRTSSFQFKGKSVDLRSIAKQLGVAYVLEGSVRQSGERMRVTAQLIEGRNGIPRWSQTYDRDFSDVLKLQAEIATKVVREVETDAIFSEIVSRKTVRNPEAYTAFLQGVDAGESGSQQANEKALDDFQRALDLDPSFAEAASALAGTYLFLGNFGFMPAAAAYEKARNAAQLALKLDSNQYEAHAVLSRIHIEYDWDWPAAEREFKFAKALAFRGMGSTQGSWPELSMTLGRWDDALELVNASVATDPLDANSYSWLGFVELRRGRLPEAEAALRRALELIPTFPFMHYSLALVLLARGEPDAALEQSVKEPSESARLVGSAMAYFALGRKAESDAAMAQFVKSYAPYIPSGIAAAYAFRGEPDEAFNWLERAYSQRDPLLYRFKFTTEFDKLHDDPRYEAFLKKMNLPSD